MHRTGGDVAQPSTVSACGGPEDGSSHEVGRRMLISVQLQVRQTEGEMTEPHRLIFQYEPEDTPDLSYDA
jgi:hypothetical protein